MSVSQYQIVYALDLSKSSTGFCISLAEITEERVKILKTYSGRLTPPSNDSYTTKHYHLAINSIKTILYGVLEEFLLTIADDILTNCHMWMIYEHPIFNSSQSPLQFYIHQSIQDLFESIKFNYPHNARTPSPMNIVGFSTGMVKSFAASLTAEKASMGGTNKDEMRRLYLNARELKIIPQEYKAEESIKSSDEIDAIILNILGNISIANASLRENRIVDAFFKNTEAFREIFKAHKCLRLEEWTMPNHLTIIKATNTKLMANDHLSIAKSKMFLPARTLSLLSRKIMLALTRLTEAERKESYKQIMAEVKFSQRSKELFVNDGIIELAVNNAGKLHAHSDYSVQS